MSAVRGRAGPGWAGPGRARLHLSVAPRVCDATISVVPRVGSLGPGSRLVAPSHEGVPPMQKNGKIQQKSTMNMKGI